MSPSVPTQGDLFDRSAALREVEAATAEARRAGKAALIRIVGPAGIGKSSFLNVLAARSKTGAIWIRSTPLSAVIPGSALASAVPALLEDESEHRRRIEVCAAFRNASAIYFDDTQWLDEVSTRLVLQAVAALENAVFIFADRRDEAPELPFHKTVRLGPLRAASAVRLVRTHYPDVDDATVGAIVAAADGIPFALAFLAQDAAGRSATAADAHSSVVEAMARRLGQCSAAARDVARFCALPFLPIPLTILERAASLNSSETTSAIAELGDLFVAVDGIVSARHACIAEAVAKTVIDPFPFFRRLFDAYDETDDRPQSLAVMVVCARTCGDDRQAPLALRLARTLAGSGAYGAALRYAELAIRAAPRPVGVEYAQEYAGISQHLLRDEEAATYLRGEIRAAIGRADGEAAAQLLAVMCSAAVAIERTAELETLAQRISSVSPGDAAVSDTLRSVRLAAYAATGEIARFWHDYPPGEPLLRDRRYAALVHALEGSERAARTAFANYCGALSPRHARQTSSDRALLATIGLWNIGTEALSEVDEAWSEDGDSGTYPTGTALRLILRLAQGRWSDADSIVASIPVNDPNYREPYSVLDARMCFTAIARRALTGPARTLASLRSLIGTGRVRHAIGPASWYCVALQTTDAEIPDDIVSFVSAHLDESPMPYLFGALPLSVAWLSGTFGERRCIEALGERQRFGSRWHEAHDALARGSISGDRETLRTARESFDALHAPVFAMLAGLRLPIPPAADVMLAESLGVVKSLATPRRISLTRRERDVADLAVQGASNAEIARLLAIRERTVETHLTNIFRKLNVRGRSALARALLRPRL